MRAPASAYAALGLEPDADRGTVERAYRDLIKRYHPDRSGGDAARAAEINRAYFELSRVYPLDLDPDERIPPEPIRTSAGVRRRRRRRRGARPIWPVVLIAAGTVAILERERLAFEMPEWTASLSDWRAPPLSGGRSEAVPIDAAALDGPLAETAIARSIEQVIEMTERGDEEALAGKSRDCHRRLRADPDLEQLDRCAAFDDAVAAIGDRDPMNDSGVFSASAITARQMTGANLLSGDFLAIERRLDRIRMVVQLTLRPVVPQEQLVPTRRVPASVGQLPDEI
jgi:curved DNA-binding protein CbpA